MDVRYECAICFEERLQSEFGVIKCGHEFCKVCLNECARRGNTCPLCRKPFDSSKIKFLPTSTCVAPWKVPVISLDCKMMVVDVGPSMTFEELTFKIRAGLNLAQAGEMLFFTDEMHIFVQDPVDTRVADLVRVREALYVHVLPSELEEKKYETCTSRDAIFGSSEYWEPAVRQGLLAQSIFLCTLLGLRRMLQHGDYAALKLFLYSHLRQIFSFSPFVLALKHVLDGELVHNFEKHIVASALYWYGRSLLRAPEAMPVVGTFQDNEVLSQSALILKDIFSPQRSTGLKPLAISATEEQDSFLSVRVTSSKGDVIPDMVQISGQGMSPELRGCVFSKAELLRIPVADRYDRVKLAFSNDMVRETVQTRRLQLMARHLPAGCHSYEIWNNSVINPQIKKGPPVEAKFLDRLRELELDPHCSFFCFFAENKPSYGMEAVNGIAVTKELRAVYILDRQKQEEGTWNCFDPLDVAEKVKVDFSELMNAFEFRNGMSLPVKQAPASLGPVTQVDVVCLDLSGSMQDIAFQQAGSASSVSRQEATAAFFSAFLQRIQVHGYKHAIGMVAFGEKLFVEPPTRDRSVINARLTNLSDVSSFVGGLTALKQAVSEAIKQVTSFRESVKRSELPARILVLSDGQNNVDGTSYQELAVAARNAKIVIDSVQLDNLDQEVAILTHGTGGVILAPESLASGIGMFEEEPVHVLASRGPVDCFQGDLQTVTGKVCWDQAFKGVPPMKQLPAVAAPATLGTKVSISERPGQTMSHKRHTRVSQELKAVMKRFTEGKSKHNIFLVDSDIFVWKIIFHPDSGTPYSGGLFLMTLSFPEAYPQVPPEVRFVTPIYHCNISSAGRVCHQILQDAYTPAITVHEILSYLQGLLSDPNPADGLDTNKSLQLLEDRKNGTTNYNQAALQATKLHANLSVEALKKKYALTE